MDVVVQWVRAVDDSQVAGMYVALGDSMSIDDYAGGGCWGEASLLHRNRDADFPWTVFGESC